MRIIVDNYKKIKKSSILVYIVLPLVLFYTFITSPSLLLPLLLILPLYICILVNSITPISLYITLLICQYHQKSRRRIAPPMTSNLTQVNNIEDVSKNISHVIYISSIS